MFKLAIFKWSVVALLAGNGADIASSYGHQELNPVLGQHQFNGESTAIKLGLTGGIVIAEFLWLKHHPQSVSTLSKTNFTFGEGFGYLAVRNYAVTH